MVSLVLSAALLGLAVLGWGDWRSFFWDLPRAAASLTGIAVAIGTGLSGFNFSPGRREEVGTRWLFATMTPVAICSAFLPPFMDQHDIWTIDGEVARYAGATMWIGGNALRMSAMLALGERFSALVAIQEDHELVTDGVYRGIRHPSYLGTLLAVTGWALLFRSAVGLLIAAGSVYLAVARIEAEEELLASHFGRRYVEYQRRTWRLMPFVY